MYSKLPLARSRGVAAEHAALSRPRSRVRIPSGPLNKIIKINLVAYVNLQVYFYLLLWFVFNFPYWNRSQVLILQYMAMSDIGLHNLIHNQRPMHSEYQNQDNL